MRKFFKLFLLLGIIIFSANISKAEEIKVLVLPDNIQFESTNYVVYPDSSIIFASDTINELKKYNHIQTVSMQEVRDALRKNTKLALKTKNALKEFKYNYNVPFVDFASIASCFNTDKVLIITSQTDVQNYFLARTVWDFLNIPGATVINPTYKMSTYAVLIDVKKEYVIWEGLYYKNIKSIENRMVPQAFAPATEQLQKIKKYSVNYLSADIAKMVQEKTLPIPLELKPDTNEIVNVSNTELSDGIQNINNLKTFSKNMSLPAKKEPILKPKNSAHKNTNYNDFGVLINDI